MKIVEVGRKKLSEDCKKLEDEKQKLVDGKLASDATIAALQIQVDEFLSEKRFFIRARLSSCCFLPT